MYISIIFKYSGTALPWMFPGAPIEIQWGSRRYTGRTQQAGVIRCHMMLPGQNLLTLTHLEPSCIQQLPTMGLSRHCTHGKLCANLMSLLLYACSRLMFALLPVPFF